MLLLVCVRTRFHRSIHAATLPLAAPARPVGLCAATEESVGWNPNGLAKDDCVTKATKSSAPCSSWCADDICVGDHRARPVELGSCLSGRKSSSQSHTATAVDDVSFRCRDVCSRGEQPDREGKGASVCTAASDSLCLCVCLDVCLFVHVFSLSYHAKGFGRHGKMGLLNATAISRRAFRGHSFVGSKRAFPSKHSIFYVCRTTGWRSPPTTASSQFERSFNYSVYEISWHDWHLLGSGEWLDLM